MKTTFSMVTTIALNTLFEAWRTNFTWIMLGIWLFGVSFTIFLNEITLTETVATQTIFLAFFWRLTSIYAVSLFSIISLTREFQDHTLYLWLALAKPRSHYILGKLVGYWILAIISALFFSLILWFYCTPVSVLFWTLSLAAEMMIVTTLGVLAVLTFRQVIHAFSLVISFYLLSRIMSSLLQMTQGDLYQNTPSWGEYFTQLLLFSIAYVLPDFSQFTQTAWLVYPTAQDIPLLYLTLQTCLYLSLLTIACIVDWYRQNI